MSYAFDRFLGHAELGTWLDELAADHPHLVEVTTYGRSHEGRELWLATVTDRSTGRPGDKPAHWCDANIHSVELAGGVAAIHLLHHLVTGFGADEAVTRALRTRTFYVAPRVNPDGVEAALGPRPRLLRSSTRPWPWRQPQRMPGLVEFDVDGDGRLLTMRLADPDGAWTTSAKDPRVLVPVPPEGVAAGAARYRLLVEGEIVDHDGWTVPTPSPPEGLDLNRNFPAGWSLPTPGRGDHPLAEPEVDALVRAIVARPNVCSYNAFHTSGGVLLRPSSTRDDATLPRRDLWVWGELGRRAQELTGYPTHSVFEDFTWDRAKTMAGAADDWAYEHLGVYSWTTELWDVVAAATGTKQSTQFWYLGPTEDEELAVLRWAERVAPDAFVDWRPFDHPQLGPVEIGGWDQLGIWVNPPTTHLAEEVRGHSELAVLLALAAPELAVPHGSASPLGEGSWAVEVGIANVGWLPTHVTAHARDADLVLPLVAELEGAEVVGGPRRLELGQLAGRSEARFRGRNDGTPDRALARWTVLAAPGDTVTISVRHPRAGAVRSELVLAPPPD
jgi:hypothetical protein